MFTNNVSFAILAGPDHEIYCKSCYSFEFGAKSRSRPRAGRMNRYGETAILNIQSKISKQCITTYQIVLAHEKGSIIICSRARSVPSMFLNPADDILARSTVETWVIKAEKGNADCCPKCDGKVFEAEKLVTASVSDLNINIYIFNIRHQ